MNAFSKEERVAFDDMLEGFNDQLAISPMVSKFDIAGVTAERANDTMWRPMPYIAQSYDGIDQTGNFGSMTQLSVPSSIGFQKSSNFTLSATELRDGTQENRMAKAARQKLASDVNVALLNTATNQGTVFVQRSGAATGYDDVAQADAAFNELGIGMDERYMALASRDYNGMAGNLAARETMNDKPTRAFEKSYVGNVAGFETVKLDYGNRLIAAAGTTVTIDGAGQYYTPKATDNTQLGQQNVDNRYQNITIAVTSGAVKVGDAFTIAGVNSVHHITKQDTGQLKTFRVTGIVSGAGGSGVVQISPAIVSNGGSTDAEAQYQNVTDTPADGAAITWLNIATASINPFWHSDAISLIPARYEFKDNGLAVMRGTTDQGIDVLMVRDGDINDLGTKYRMSVFFGTVMTNPEMAGVMMFNQS